jgi:hypothetical protein
MKLKISSDQLSVEPSGEANGIGAPDSNTASYSIAQRMEQSRGSSEPYKAGDGIGTPYGNLVFKGIRDDGYLHVQTRTTDYRVPTHLGDERDAIRAWAIRSVEQGHINRGDLYTESSANPAQPIEQSRASSEPYRAGDGIGTPQGNLVFKGVGDDGYLHVQTRTTDYRVPTHLGNDRDAIRAWAIRSVERGDIDAEGLYQSGQQSRSRSETYKAGDGIGTPYGNLVFKGVGDDGYLHVQTRTTDYRVPTALGDDRDAIRAWAIRSVERGDINRASLYRPGQESEGVQRSEVPLPTPSSRSDGFIFSPQLNDRLAGDFPRVNGEASIPDDWKSGKNPLDIWRRNEVSTQNKETDNQLLSRFNTELQLATQFNPIASSLLRHFMGSTGQTFNSPPGSEWSNLIKKDSEGQRIGTAITERIYNIADQQYASTGKVDLGTMKVPLTYEDRAVWGNKPLSPAVGAFGSTDGLEVEIQNARFDPETKKISGNVRITIIDTFGLSNSDNDSPGQVAMWLLQHQRGYKPFTHQVQFDVPLDFTVRTRNSRDGEANQSVA